MAPMKRPAAKSTDPIKSRCASVRRAVQQAEGFPERVQEMLCSTITSTLGQPKASRQPFTERFVAMIQEVLEAEEKRLQTDKDGKEAAFAELTPAKATREAAVEQAKAAATEKGEALEKAKQAVVDAGQAVKDAAAAAESAKEAQAAGDKEWHLAADKKAKLAETQRYDFAPLAEGALPEELRAPHVKAVMAAGEEFGFDSSLMATAARVLGMAAGDRSGFDSTCLEQLKEAFAGGVAKLAAELAACEPAKAERASALERAEAAKQAAESAQASAKEQVAAAKEVKVAAEEEKKSAAKLLASFMPDLKKSGDALDAAKHALQSFTDGAKHAFSELKDWKEGDFKAPVKSGSSYYETIDGMACDRGIIDACRTAVAGAGDGRVSVEDAKAVFEKIVDGGKETRAERWTLRHCLQEFKWTDAAQEWIIAELKKVPQEDLGSPAKKAKTEGGGYYEVIDGFKCDRGIIDACRQALGDQGDACISVEDAHEVWAKAADGNTVTDAEKWTLRYCLSAFPWAQSARDWLIEEFHK